MRDGSRRQLTPRELQRQRRKAQIQRRRLVAALVLLGLIILIVVLIATCGGGTSTTTSTTAKGAGTPTTLVSKEYTAELTGTETDATGTFTLTYDADSAELSYNLTLEALKGPSTAIIYQKAEDGSDDLALYSLYSETPEDTEYSGVLAQGIIDETKFTETLEGKTVGDLIALIESGEAYVKVGTTEDLDALTGQIVGETGGETTASTDEDTTESTDEDTTDSSDESQTTDTTSDEDETTTTE